MNHEVKKEETNSDVTLRVIVENVLEKVPVDELLGSVTTYPEGNDKNQSLRSSARVIKKIKLDANLNASPSTSNGIDKQAQEKKEEQKPEQVPQKEQKKLRPIWSSDDKLLFFEALNEYGKDFENIHNYIIQKHKKKNVPDNLLITKENVRHLYYKTWHKISKYLKFSDGTKKIVQELYGLINYGELRKKIGVFSLKINHKLNELIYNGCVAVRIKGKMVKVKTPMCMALRRLNKLDDKDDELKLPSRVLVELRPRDMSAFLKVQNMALNPRIRAFLPLQKKLNTLITCVSKKWKAAELEYLKNIFPLEEMTNGESSEEFDMHLVTPRLKFAPLKNTKVNVLEANLNEYLMKESISLKAFEDRMGIESSRSLLMDKKENKKANSKARIDSSIENTIKSIVKQEVQDSEKSVQIETESINAPISTNNPLDLPQNNVGDAAEKVANKFMDEVLKDLFSSIDEKNVETSTSKKCNDLDVPATSNRTVKGKKENETSDVLHTQACSKSDENIDNNKNKNISTEDQLSKLDRIRNGWTAEDCDTLTIGELYLMFGSSSKLVLEYYWTEVESDTLSQNSDSSNNEDVANETNVGLKQNFGFSGALRKLVSMVKLQQKKPPTKCPCGHVCSPKNAVPKKNHNKSIAADIEEKNCDEAATEAESTIVVNGDDQKLRNVQFDDFLQPPPVHLIAQLDSIQKLKPKYSARKGRRSRTKQLVVERELPLTPKASSAHQIVRMNIISQNNSNSEAATADDHCEVDTQTTELEIDSFVGQVLYTSGSETHNSNANCSTLDIPMELSEEHRSNLSEFLHDSSRALSPSVILKENANNWIASEVGDFSLSSFLGHLESPMKSHDDSLHEVDAQVRSLLIENSFDYTAKFADLANNVASDS